MSGMPDRETELKTFICFDYGKKRIGVATGQSLTRTASELETIRAVGNKPDWQSISRIIQQWQPAAFVLGLPLNDDGSDHQVTKAVRKFSNQLKERYRLPVYFIDERLSSREAEQQIDNKRAIMRDKGLVDKMAARILLQDWLDQNEG